MKIATVILMFLGTAAFANGSDTTETRKLRGLATTNAKLWIVNECKTLSQVYYGDKSEELPSQYLQNGGSSDGLDGSDFSIWVDQPGVSGCYNNQCNDAGRTLAEVSFNVKDPKTLKRSQTDAFDISFVKGFNVGVKFELIGGTNRPGNPSKVVCADESCMDAFMLCDTAAKNVDGGAPNWMNDSGSGVTYKVTFCPSETSNTQENNQLAARKKLQKTLSRYTTPLDQGKPMVWCECAWNRDPTPAVANYDKYTIFSGDRCGAV